VPTADGPAYGRPYPQQGRFGGHCPPANSPCGERAAFVEASEIAAIPAAHGGCGGDDLLQGAEGSGCHGGVEEGFEESGGVSRCGGHSSC